MIGSTGDIGDCCDVVVAVRPMGSPAPLRVANLAAGQVVLSDCGAAYGNSLSLRQHAADAVAAAREPGVERSM